MTVSVQLLVCLCSLFIEWTFDFLAFVIYLFVDYYSFVVYDIIMLVSIYFFLCLFFFFKQKTAYEMRISDWSSDVCSSDLVLAGRGSERDGDGGNNDSQLHGIALSENHGPSAAWPAESPQFPVRELWVPNGAIRWRWPRLPVFPTLSYERTRSSIPAGRLRSNSLFPAA